jgi:hypothetical protein
MEIIVVKRWGANAERERERERCLKKSIRACPTVSWA